MTGLRRPVRREGRAPSVCAPPREDTRGDGGCDPGGASPDPARADTGLGCEDSVSPFDPQPVALCVAAELRQAASSRHACARPGRAAAAFACSLSAFLVTRLDATCVPLRRQAEGSVVLPR